MLDRLHLAPGRTKLLLFALPPALAAGAAVAALLYAPRPSVTPGPAVPAGQAQAPDQAALPSSSGLLVEVTGAVAHPGIYPMQKGDRVTAAIAAAGGLTPQADPARLPDMAKRLTDGMQVDVPAIGAPSRSGTSTGTSRSTKIDLNAATVDQLAAIPGFTPEMASAAVQYRQEYGGFASVKELVTVLNMSQADYVLARKYLRV